MSSNEQLQSSEIALYRGSVEHLVCLSLPLVPQWGSILQPALSNAVDRMLATGHLPIETADAFFDIGHFCLRLGEDIMNERTRRGIPLPPGPDEEPGQ